MGTVDHHRLTLVSVQVDLQLTLVNVDVVTKKTVSLESY